MPIISYKCEKCGASMTFDEQKGKLVCPSCNAEYSFQPNQQIISQDADVSGKNPDSNIIEYYYDDGSIERVTDSIHILHGKQSDLSLVKVVIPQSIQAIDPWAFKDCRNLKEAVFQGGKLTKGLGDAFNGTGIKVLDLSNYKNISFLSGSAFSSVEKVILSESVDSIPDNAFSGWTNLQQINLPQTLISIGNSAFSGCSNLQLHINSPYISFIGERAFHNCLKLTAVTLTNEVLVLGREAFSNCSGLEYVILPQSIQSIGKRCFYRCSSIRSIRLPFTTGMKATNSEAVFGCTGLEKLIFDPTQYNAPFGYKNSFEGGYDSPWNPDRVRIKKVIFIFRSQEIALQFFTGAYKGNLKTYMQEELNTTNREILNDLNLQKKAFLRDY